MSGNLLANPGFEAGSAERASRWAPYASGYEVDPNRGRGGSRALRLTSSVASDENGAFQVVELNQDAPKPVYFSGYSRTSRVTGETDSDYSVYLDVYYADGTPLYGQVLTFSTGTHGWQFREAFVIPSKPIKSINVYCLLRTSHTGTAWFDDLSLREVKLPMALFDLAAVSDRPPTSPPFQPESFSVSTTDGLSISLSRDGGAVTSVAVNGREVYDPERSYASGFFVRDTLNNSDYLHVAGPLSESQGVLKQDGSIRPLDLDVAAEYLSDGDTIHARATVADTSGKDRAITLYFALPVGAAGWTWGDDVRTSRVARGTPELSNFGGQSYLGANGWMSKYPWADLSRSSDGIAIAIRLDQPRVARLACNTATNQFYVAFDLGLSPAASKTPSRASVELVVYRFDGRWGFRAAAEGYYRRFPAFFTRRVPPHREGIWVAFSDLSPISNVGDFGIAFHELGSLDQVAFDDRAGIYSFRYISEPWSHWLPIDDPSVDGNDYADVMRYLKSKLTSDDSWERRSAQATLSSGFFDASGKYRYAVDAEPWCAGVGGCAVFILNPAPDVYDATYPLNKARLDWNDEARRTYATIPGLDGEYVDSYLSHATTMDFRRSHFSATGTPLTPSFSERALGIPEVFATTEFARWLTGDVHTKLGKWTMANGILLDMPWGADLFDFMGAEVDWLSSGEFVPEDDQTMNYRRTLSYQRPYGLLMNTDFGKLGHALVERYFQVCTFYGIYPSMFSANASENRYWDDPALYNRDRPLFRRYVPLIRNINSAGWQPVTRSVTSDEAVLIERFGSWPVLYFALRNTRKTAASVQVSIEAPELNLPAEALVARRLIAGGSASLSAPAGIRSVAVTLDAESTEVIRIERK